MEDHKQLIFGKQENLFSDLMQEFGVSESNVISGVKHLMDWYKAQEHLPKYALDERFILSIYTLNKLSIERSKSKLDILLTVRSVMPEYFDNRDSKDFNEAIEYIEPVIIPQLMPDHTRVLCNFYTEKDPEFYDAEAGLRFLFMMTDLRMFWDISMGDNWIWDLKHLKIGHLTKVTPSLIKKASFVIQKAYTARIKSIHFINSPIYGQMLFNIIKGVFKKKIVERMYFHESLDDLHKMIPKEYLPKELGGINLPQKELTENLKRAMMNDHWKKWFMESCTQKVDESKRHKKTQSFDEILGFSGTFRRLEVD